MMETNGLSAADVYALTGGNDGRNNGNGNWDNPFMYLVWLAVLGGGWGNGFGGFGGGGANGTLTRAELSNEFALNGLSRQLEGIQNGICDGFYAMNTTALQGFNSLGTQVAENRFAAQQCCCETQRSIDAVRYENAKNTCDIVTNANMNTRDIIDSQNAGFQRILDKMNEQEILQLRTDLQTANFQLSQQAQSANLLSQLRPFPQPAYITCSPYASVTNAPYVGCGCGCN